ncbi:Flavodoxin [Acetitomaculum ruminis DSM 5522]|uniref:Flavodoxin n=1 Tax=Acetitomaculum ruminis DSM 5522 TaxID=1120918 RepID=A0A1I1ADA9_9FIRM|nr:flavodoxin family protein [Acetitomaculum ruminis]SFB35492.1 Flavodoxin [Acetitomaculum ruminis DSM 5522]
MSKKAIIICASTHHGNTRKLANAIADKYGVEIVDATKTKEKDLSEYDLIGFASGIYAGKLHQAVINFAKNNLSKNKDVFYIITSAMGKDQYKSIETAIEGKNANVVGTFACKGYNTFGPFKLVGGTAKGHPDTDDINNALRFYEGLIGA